MSVLLLASEPFAKHVKSSFYPVHITDFLKIFFLITVICHVIRPLVLILTAKLCGKHRKKKKEKKKKKKTTTEFTRHVSGEYQYRMGETE